MAGGIRPSYNSPPSHSPKAAPMTATTTVRCERLVIRTEASAPVATGTYPRAVSVFRSRRRRLIVATTVLLLLVVLAFVPIGSSTGIADDPEAGSRVVPRYNSVLSLLAGGSMDAAYAFVALVAVTVAGVLLYVWALRPSR